MSIQALSNALSGLRVAQLQLDTISNNVSNASTPGYTRKILPQSTQVAAGTGEALGVRSGLLIRNVDYNLSRDLWTQVSATSALDIKGVYLNRIEAFHGPPDSESSISAELVNLQNDIAALADDPSNSQLQKTIVDQAGIVADRFNDFGDLLTQARNDTQNDIEFSVNEINGLLQRIADLNTEIRAANNLGRSSANLEDLRDAAVRELSENIEITSFLRGDNVLVVQTANGALLADDTAEELFFNPVAVGPTSTYPDVARPIYLGGDPATNINATDITLTDLGGKLGGLIELRDSTLPRYQAQIDELAHKTALRFEQQGLRLFTNSLGIVPADTAPEIGTDPAVPVEYVGFASEIQVNNLILADESLIQSGTYNSDIPVLAGSSEVLDRILEFTFGNTEYQEAIGTVNLITLAADDLQQHLGIFSENQITLGPDLTQFSEIDSLGANTTDIRTLISDLALDYPIDDEFRIQLYDRADAATPVTVDIDLSDLGANPAFAIGNADPTGTLADGTIDNALDQLVAFINDTIIAEEGLGNIPADLQARATINGFGQFVFESRGDVEFLSSGFANAMGDEVFRGLFGTDARRYETTDPFFEVQVGTDDPVRITIEPGEDETDLLAKLEKLTSADPGVKGLFVDDVAFAAGTLSLRPGIDGTALGGPVYGGSLTLVSGVGVSDGTGASGVVVGSNILEAIFGSTSPISSVAHASETNQNLGVGSGDFVAFRVNNLGQNTDISTGIISNATLVDYAQKMISNQTQDLIVSQGIRDDEASLRDVLDNRLSNESGVNIDEELSNLILVQTAYSASARTVTAVQELFDELLNAVR